MDRIDELTILLRSNNYRTRLDAVEALGKLGDPKAIQSLSEALTDSHAAVRVATVKALGNIGGPEACSRVHPRL